MKRLNYISLLLICLLQSGGLLLIYQCQQYVVQQEMAEELNNKQTQFQKLTISLSDYQKGKINAHEISIQGKMYDVKAIVIAGDKVTMLAIKDTKEESILENIKKAVNTDRKQKKEIPHKLVRLLTLFYTSPNTIRIFLLPVDHPNKFASFCENTLSHQSEIPSPPPKLV